MSVRRICSIVALLVVILEIAACTTGQPKSLQEGAEGEQQTNAPLFEVPRHWELVDERDGETLYQANLRNNKGAGRMLVGRLQLKKEVPELDGYLYRLHNDLVDRIRGEVEMVPFAEERLAWANGIVGYRTKMRGELGKEAVIIEGITLSDGSSAYFHYGLFPEGDYETGRSAYANVLRSLRPIQGTQQVNSGGLEIAGSSEPQSSDVGSDGAASPAAYQSPASHLGVVAWGTSRDEVRQQAGQPLREGEKAVGYRCQYLGAEDCVVVYLFEGDKLTHGGFLLEQTFEAPREYVARYLRMTKQLTDTLGRPLQSAAIWSNTEFKSQGAKWGDALASGHVLFGTVWQVGPTKVLHSLRKTDDGGIEHRILLSNEELRATGQAQASK